MKLDGHFELKLHPAQFRMHQFELKKFLKNLVIEKTGAFVIALLRG